MISFFLLGDFEIGQRRRSPESGASIRNYVKEISTHT
jgi:hypothetical protein